MGPRLGYFAERQSSCKFDKYPPDRFQVDPSVFRFDVFVDFSKTFHKGSPWVQFDERGLCMPLIYFFSVDLLVANDHGFCTVESLPSLSNLLYYFCISAFFGRLWGSSDYHVAEFFPLRPWRQIERGKNHPSFPPKSTNFIFLKAISHPTLHYRPI